jgi:eukaryotic-like serine/threonine-protein kinase
VSTLPFEPIQFGRYQLVEKLAVGGMAEIFKAKSHGAHGFEKTLVLKRILPSLAEDTEFLDMFIDEAKVMVQLNHPKVVQVLDFGEAQGQYYIAMEYVQGVDCLALLRACARRRCRPNTGIAVHIIADILDALDYAHNLKAPDGRSLELIHRDISPSNILISKLGDVKLGDFGIARAEIRRRHTETGALKGKYGYMAPEVVTGGVVDHRADLFSVGIVLAELLMIRRLFIAPSDLEVLLQVRDARLDRLNQYGQHIRPELRQILDSALARDPALRYQDAASFRDALHRFLFDEKRMVRSIDVANFLHRLHDEEQSIHSPSSEIQPLSPVSEAPAVTTQVRAPVADRRAPAAPPRGAPSSIAVSPRRPLPEGTEYLTRTGERHQVSTPPDRRAVIGTEPPTVSLVSTTRTSVPASVVDALPPPTEMLSEDPVGVWTGDTPSLLGRKRKILLGPPPRPEPLPHSYSDSGELPYINSEDILSAVREMENASSSAMQDFRTGLEEKRNIPEVTSALPEKRLEQEAQEVAASRVVNSAIEEMVFVNPSFKGNLAQHSLFKVLFRLAVAEESGLLSLQTDQAIKEIYLEDGDPQFVTSNLAEELFGQYLVQKGVLSPGELSMALAMLPHFEGKLGNVLVALKLLRPVQVLRHLTHQVRQKLLNAFSCEDGTFSYFKGKLCEHESAPLGLDAFEVIGAGVLALPEPTLIKRLQSFMDKHPRSKSPPPVPPEVFRLGAQPRQVFDELDGRFTLIDLLRRFDDPERRQMFARVVYLLLETKLADIE